MAKELGWYECRQYNFTMKDFKDQTYSDWAKFSSFDLFM